MQLEAICLVSSGQASETNAEINEDAVASVLGLLKRLSPTDWLADGAPIELCFKDTDFCRSNARKLADTGMCLYRKESD